MWTDADLVELIIEGIDEASVRSALTLKQPDTITGLLVTLDSFKKTAIVPNITDNGKIVSYYSKAIGAKRSSFNKRLTSSQGPPIKRVR